uniref:Cytochrome P450 n=1 Tax=Kalanchoe fedtschenkoi TaxID=63787 RepID=A0A7N0RH58_KALFE
MMLKGITKRLDVAAEVFRQTSSIRRRRIRNVWEHIPNITSKTARMEHPSFSVFSPIAITYASAGLIVWLTASLWLRRGRREASFPPGPRPWPVIGNLNLLINRLIHQSLHKLSETYGPIMKLKFGSSDVVVISSPEMAKEILKTHDSSFAARPRLAIGKYLLYNSSDILWGNGPHWRQGRKILSVHLFDPTRLESYEYIRMEERRDFLARLYDLRGKEVRVMDHLSQINLGIVSRIALGKNYFSGSKPLELLEESSSVSHGEMQEMLDESFTLSGVFVVGDWMPWLARLDLGGHVKRMKNLNQKFDKLFDFIIKEHKMAGNGREKEEKPKDMMDVLLDLVDDPDLEVKLTTDNVKAFILDFLAGGTDTSATTLEWAMAELMKNPDKINKATEELDRIIGRERWVEDEDMPSLPYLDAIIKETFRLHPPATLLAPHRAIKDCKINNYDIPKGTTVFLNVWSIGRNPSAWDSPEEFRPERFLNKAIDMKGQNFELLPFGSGRRMCLGYSLGLKMVQSTLANMLQGFNWTLPQETKPQDLDMDETYKLSTPRKHPLVAIVEPRLSAHLYA